MSNSEEGIAELKQKREDAAINSARARARPRHSPKKREELPPQPSNLDGRGSAGGPIPSAESGAMPSRLTRATIYLDESAENLLAEVEILGRRCRPRVDVSRSAIARIALERLADQLTPEQILQLLQDRVVASPARVGRPRM